MLEIIRNVLDNSECAIGIVCDFQKAFDMVDNDILLSKQSNHGMERIAFDWFKDYVWNRHQDSGFRIFINCFKATGPYKRVHKQQNLHTKASLTDIFIAHKHNMAQ